MCLSDSRASIVQLGLGKGNFTFKPVAWCGFEIPNGLIVNGEIQKAKELLFFLKKEWNKRARGNFTSHSVLLALPEVQTYSMDFTFTSVLNEEELRELVPNEIIKTFPFSIDKIYWDFRVVYNDGEKKHVFCVVSEKRVVQDYVRLLRGLNKEVEVVTSESEALSFPFQESSQKQGELFVRMREHESLFFIHEKEMIYLSTDMGWGFGDLVDKLAKKGKQARVREYFFKKGLSGKRRRSRMDKNIAVVLSPWIEKIKRVARDYQKIKQGEIGCVLILGQASLIPHLDVLLTQELKLPVKIATGPYDISQIKKWNAAHLGAAGLSQRSFSRHFGKFEGINLLREAVDLD